MAEPCQMCAKWKSRETAKVRLKGSLKHGSEVWACPKCDVPDESEKKGRGIIEISWKA